MPRRTWRTPGTIRCPGNRSQAKSPAVHARPAATLATAPPRIVTNSRRLIGFVLSGRGQTLPYWRAEKALRVGACPASQPAVFGFQLKPSKHQTRPAKEGSKTKLCNAESLSSKWQQRVTSSGYRAAPSPAASPRSTDWDLDAERLLGPDAERLLISTDDLYLCINGGTRYANAACYGPISPSLPGLARLRDCRGWPRPGPETIPERQPLPAQGKPLDEHS